MASAENIFGFVQARSFGGARPRYREAQLVLHSMTTPKWTAPVFLPAGGDAAKHVVVLTRDAFCIVRKGGRADAFAADPERALSDRGRSYMGPSADWGPVRWLTSLTMFDGEKMRLVAHMSAGASLLTVFSVADRQYRGQLFVRVLAVPDVILGRVCVIDCGSLSTIVVPSGGFVEYDSQNLCVWVNDCESLRCWDAKTFDLRFMLGPWDADCLPNVRFTRGFVGLLVQSVGGGLEVKLHSSTDGKLERHRKAEDPPSPQEDIVFLELINQQVLLKRAGEEVRLIDLNTNKETVIEDTKDWEPELFIFLPLQELILARFATCLELWTCREHQCLRVGTVQRLPDFSSLRFSIDERHATALVVQPRGTSGEKASRTHASSPPGRARSTPTLTDTPLRRRPESSTPSAPARCARHRGSCRCRSRSAPKRDPRGLASLLNFSPETSEELCLLDLSARGAVRAVVDGVCSNIGGGSVAHLCFDVEQRTLMILGESGGLSLYASGARPENACETSQKTLQFS